MIEYVIEDEKILYISAEDQRWDKETLNELRKKHNIIFMTSGDAYLPVMIINADGHKPVIAIGNEDDGAISFPKRYGHFVSSFSSYWIDSFIADLQEAKRIIDKS